MTSYQSINPATNSLINSWPSHSDTQAEQALATADALYHSDWSQGDIQPRLQVLSRLADLLDRQVNELAMVASSEMDKLIKQSRGEVQLCPSIARYYAENAERFLAPVPYPSDLGEA